MSLPGAGAGCWGENEMVGYRGLLALAGCTGWWVCRDPDAVLMLSGSLYILTELSSHVEWSSFAPIFQNLVMQRLELTGVSQSLTLFPSMPCLLS